MRISNCGVRIYQTVGLLLAASVTLAAAQELPTPAPTQNPLPGGASVLDQASQTPSASPSSSVSPSITPAVVPAPTGSAPPAATRSVRISFLPPPLEGTISLGIYNQQNRLVRVLHQEAELDEFTIGDDALSTKWDGRDDGGLDLPPGRYHARGFAVGKIKNEAVSPAPSSTPAATPGLAKITVRLMPNPLGEDATGKVELAVGFDNENSFLKTTDGLPLYTVSEKSNLQRVGIVKAGERSADVWQDDGVTSQQFRLSNLNQMMAFDCGDFELK